MKHAWIFAFLAFTLPLAAQTPTCSNFVDQAEPTTGTFPAAGYTLFYLPHAVGANNRIIVWVTGSSGDAITVTDSSGDTFSTDKNYTDSSNGQTMAIFSAGSAAASANEWIKVSHSASDAWVMMGAMECTNTGAVDVTTGNHASGNTVAAGSITPTAANDLIVMAGWNDYTTGAQGSITAGSQSNIAWALGAADRATTTYMQYGVYSSTSAINPTLSTTGTAGFVAAAVAYKAAAVGTAFPSGIQVNCMKTLWVQPSGKFALPRTEQFPCPSLNNSEIVDWIGACPDTLSAPRDSGSNTWSSTGSATANGSCVQKYYAQNATVSPAQNISFSGTPGDDSAKLYGIQNGSTSSFFCTRTTATGSQASPGNIDPSDPVTPCAANGLVISSIGVESNTQNGTTTAGANFKSCYWSQEVVNPGGCDQNNGWLTYPNSNTSSIDFVWTGSATTAAGQWAAESDAFNSNDPASTTRHRAWVIGN
jgi:hypothetical protein